jgi:hypothetical protein
MELTRLLERAVAEAAELPEEERDTLGAWILADLEAGRRWDEAFAGSADQLAKLADEALREHEAGRTQELDPP